MNDEFFGVGRLLLRSAREFSSQICDELRARDHPDLKAGHALLVANLDEVGTRISTLAERAEVSKQAMGQMVRELEALGYISRAPDLSDARAILVVPTVKGRQLLQDVMNLALAIEKRHVEKIGHDELKQLRSILLKWLR